MREIPEGNKTEKATPKRRQDERKKGNIFKSKDISSALGVLAVFGALSLLWNYMFSHISANFTRFFQGFDSVTTLTGSAHIYLSIFAVQVLILSLPLLCVAMVSEIAINALQSRLNISFKQLKPDFKRLDPIKGMKRVISLRSLVELAKSILKIIIVGTVVYIEIKGNLPNFMRLSEVGLGQSFGWILKAIVNVALKAGVAMLLLGILDYLYQWWEYERKLMMSKQEIKDEYKQTEGDPLFRSYLKERQRKSAMRRMMQNVKEADVVIKNPTHYAVAIKYDDKKAGAPLVIAKGQDHLALKIIAEAEAHEILVTENPPLARGLYQAVDIGREIPAEYYQAVAEVLVFVYNLRKRTKRR